jgi:hypothetical protein
VNYISAYLDVSGVSEASVQLVPVTVKIKGWSYYEVTDISPSSVSIEFSKKN